MSLFNPPHPGLMVKDLMIEDEDGIKINSVAHAAEQLGCHRSTLNSLISTRRSLTPEMAIALETNGLGSAEHWLAMQASYDLFALRNNQVA